MAARRRSKSSRTSAGRSREGPCLRALAREGLRAGRLAAMRARKPVDAGLVEAAKTPRALRDRGGRQRLGRQARRRHHADAVDGAGGYAKLAARAIGRDHRVHALARADDRVGGAGRQAARAADAGRLVDPGDERGRQLSAVRVEGKRRPAEKRRELVDERLAAGRTAVERGLAARQRCGVRAAALEAAAAALGLRKQGVNAGREVWRFASHLCESSYDEKYRICLRTPMATA